jgi:hypothetical protein
MTATATPVEKQAVSRERPGGGKLYSVHHIVRIVVVRPAAGSTPAAASDGPGRSHGLTQSDLKAGEALLKNMGAPSSNGTSGPPQPSKGPSTQPKNMFEALEPTDIVVVANEPASVRTIDSSGEPVTSPRPAGQPEPTRRRLFAHDDRHRDTVLRVWTESDTIEYQCDEKFEIVGMERAGWKLFGAPGNPFERERGAMPYKATKERTSTTDADGNPKFVWKWTSGVVPASANNQQYKATFKIRGQKIDPDVVCGDPPPGS